MQALNVEPTASRDTTNRSRGDAQPVVGASSASATEGNAAGTRVELAVTAITLAAATSAPAEVQKGKGPQASASDATHHADHDLNSPAANLALSAEAQRLALIPAQVMDADEIEAARKVVAEAQEVVVEARQAEQANLDAELEAAREQLAEATRETAVDAPPERASEALPPASTQVQSSGGAEHPHPPAARSPFESSTPGQTGQSLDIVVGEEAPHSTQSYAPMSTRA